MDDKDLRKLNEERRTKIKRLLDDEAAPLGLVPLGERIDGELPIKNLRRGRRQVGEDQVVTLSLVESDGVLYWRDGAFAGAGMADRRRSLLGGKGEEIVDQRKATKLGRSEITGYLQQLDNKLTPMAGRLRRWKGDRLEKDEVQPVSEGRVLLFIHGTFSNSEAILEQFKAKSLNQEGSRFLSGAERKYHQILTYDHPTLSVSPMLNALDLARIFEGSKASVDVICHSRGGLVTRWWMEVFDKVPRERRAVLVGSPLGGTSLAAPDKLRNGLDLLSNVGAQLAGTMSLIPFFTVVPGLLRVVTSVTSLTAKTPVIDALVAMIPGLAAQSRIDNNPELLRLNGAAAGAPPYYAVVRGSFEPDPVGWRFWKVFSNWKGHVLDAAADHLVFNAPNDLVVDTASMEMVGEGRALSGQDVLSFDESNQVHHCNYFQQPELIAFLAERLGIPMDD